MNRLWIEHIRISYPAKGKSTTTKWMPFVKIASKLHKCVYLCRFKNYRELFDGKKCSVETDGATCTLRIHNVDFSDAGDIECQAKNRYGAVSIRAKLTVLGKMWSYSLLLLKILGKNPVFVLVIIGLILMIQSI